MSTVDSSGITICICTRNRAQELQRALDSIAASTRRPNQIVVSDDGEGDATKALVAAHALDIAYTRGPRTGLGSNRNHVISFATQDYLLFLDDDGTLGETFLELASASLLPLNQEKRLKTIVTGADIERGSVVLPNNQDLLGFQSRPYKPGEALQTVVINAALFPRPIFDHLRFDTNLKYGYDEVDFTTQAVAMGYEILPCFDAINYHFPSPIGRDEYARLADASRLYVTFKRRRWTEHSRLRGWLGLALATGHLYAGSVKRRGIAGIAEARNTVAQARSYHAAFRTSAATGNGSGR